MQNLIFACLFALFQGYYAAVLENSCAAPNINKVSSFVIKAASPIGEIASMLIKFDTDRKVAITSTALHDQLNSQKNVDRVSEPFGPLPCTHIKVPETQQNCTGGMSMTDAQKVKAAPRYTWDRGHLCPANTNRFSMDALDKTFYCVNIAPQDSWTNQNAWKDVEVRSENKLKETNGYVMTGTCSADNMVDGPTTYRGYRIPACFFKLICYKDKITKATKVVGFIGENTIVNFKDTAAQEVRKLTTFTPRSQQDILNLVTDKSIIPETWVDAQENLLPGRTVSPSDLPTGDSCSKMLTLDQATADEWHKYISG